MLDPGEQCDDGNSNGGDNCPATCNFSTSGLMVRGHKNNPARDRKACQLEWYVVNPNNAPDRFGKPSLYQVCEDQDPTCDFDARPGHCGFQVLVCLSNQDPNVPLCTPNGISALEVKPIKAYPRTPETAALGATALNKLNYALMHLHDPNNPSGGYDRSAFPPPGLGTTDINFCSQPMSLEVLTATPSQTKFATMTFKTVSKDNSVNHANLPHPRRDVSKLTLACKAQPLP